jgi:hypothetical protein
VTTTWAAWNVTPINVFAPESRAVGLRALTLTEAEAAAIRRILDDAAYPVHRGNPVARLVEEGHDA